MDLVDVSSVVLPALIGALTYVVVHRERRRRGEGRWNVAPTSAAAATALAGLAVWGTAGSDGGRLLVLAACFGLLAGGTTFAVLRRDLTPATAGTVAAACGLLIAAGFLVVLYLAPAAFLGALAVHALIRRLLPVHDRPRRRTRVALFASTATLVVLLASSTVVLYLAVGQMS